jgi:hypothetical protein
MGLTAMNARIAAGLLSLAMGAAILVLPLPARAGDDDDVPVDTKILRTILEGIGLKRDGEGIDYQERSPLVIPPNRDLPPPQTGDATIANNPAWPKDPDVARRKAEATARRNRNINEEVEREQNRLSPDELAPGAKGNPKLARTGGRADTGPSPADDGHYRLTPSELGYNGSLFSTMFGGKDESSVKTFTREPPRASLTDPPPGYRTPSPNQPYGVTKDTSSPKATNYSITHGEINSSNH